MKDLETDIVELEHLSLSTGNQGYIESLKIKQKWPQPTCWTERSRTHCSDQKRWMLPLAIFLDWRKRNGQEKVIHILLSDTGQEITEASQIRRHFFKLYQTHLSTDIIKDQRDTGLLNKIMRNFNLTSAARVH